MAAFDPKAYAEQSGEPVPFDPAAYAAEPEVRPGDAPPIQVEPAAQRRVLMAVPTDLTGFRAARSDLTPEKASDSLMAARRTGLSPQFAADNLDEVQRQQMQGAVAQALGRAPVLAGYAAQSHVHASAVKDDLDNLSFLEWAITGRWELASAAPDVPYMLAPKVTPPFWWAALKDALAEQKQIALSTKAGTVGVSPAEEEQLRQLEQAQGGERNYGAQNFATRAMEGAVRALPGLLAIGAPAAAGALSGGPGGAFLGGFLGNYVQSYGPMYRRLALLGGPDGKPLLTNDEAMGIAQLGTIGTSALATWVGGPLLSKLPGVREVLGKVGGEALSNALARPGVAKFLADRSLEFGKNYAAGIAMMMAQAAGTAATEEAAKATHGQPADLGRVGAAATDAALQAAQDLPLVAAYHPIIETIGAVARAHAEQAHLAGMIDAARKSPLVGREPGVAAEVIQQAAGQPGAADSVYIPKEVWDAYHGADAPRRAAELAQDQGRAYAEADATGGPVAIPVEEHLTKGLADAEKLLPDTTLSPDGLTANEAAKAAENLGGKGEPIPGPAPEPTRAEAASYGDAALEMLNQKPIGEIRPEYYAQAGRRMGQRAVDLAGEQDQTGLGDVQRRQAFNAVAERFAREVRAEMDKLQAGLSGVDRRALASGDPAYLSAYDAMLGALDGQGAAGALGPALDAMKAQGARVRFDETAAAEFLANPRPWKELTPPEARNLSDFVSNIRAAAARANEIAVADRRAGLREVAAQITAEVATMPSKTNLMKQSGVPLSALEQAQLTANAWNGVLLRPKTNLSWMGETTRKVIFDRIIDARNLRDRLLRETGEFYRQNVSKLSGELREIASRQVSVGHALPTLPGTDKLDIVPRAFLWKLHLEMSSAGNMDRVLGGNRWDRATVERLLYHDPETRLGRTELDFLQTILDHNNEHIWPLLKAKEERLDGVAPPKVDAIARTVYFEDGTSKRYEGGYHPLSRDTRFGIAPAGSETPAGFKSVDDFFGPNYQRAETFKPFANQRAEHASYVVDLDWDTISSHMTQALHDIAFDEPIRDIGRLVLDPEFQRAAVSALGPEKAAQIPAYIRSVATQGTDSTPRNLAIVGRAFGFLRRRMITSIVGDSIPLAALQSSHIPFVLLKGDIGGVHGIPALFSVFKPFTLGDDGARAFPTWRDSYAESTELQHRDMRNTRRVIEDMNKLPQPASVIGRGLEKWRRVSGIFLHAMDRYLSTWIYVASKNEALTRGMSREEAIGYANGKVQDLLPTHDIETAAPILTSRNIGALLIMHGFQNTVANLRQQGIHEVRLDFYNADSPAEYAKAGLGATWRVVRWTAAMAALGIGEAAAFHGPRKDQGEDWPEWLARRALAAQGMDIPWIGPILDPLASLFVSKVMTGEAKVRPISVRQAPMLALLQKGADLVGEFASGKTDDEKLFFDGAEMALVACNVPSAQTRTVAQYMYDLLQGNASPRGPLDVVSGVAGRRPSKHPESNPFTAAQDFVSGD